ncbi:MAG: hypothetical protein AXA67_04425 [Methylothermaceae bacteria B42]|nr:MAG: hypothetical protein AXA67_04425 [Methylothermaceae bacteria B42]HHJ39933.1 class I SAM-dependent methyltransferase [Methylothermaceae bacterium]
MSTDTCDLCRASNFAIVAQPGKDHCQIGLCRRCGLFFATPRLDASELEAFYHSQFTGDAGSKALSQGGFPRQKKIRSEEKHVKFWALPKVLEQFSPEGRHILDLRSRSGALSQALTQQGADVVTVDPFPANLNYARQVRNLNQTRLVSTTEIHLLNDFKQAQFDAITVLTIHLLSHLLSPHLFLQNAWRVLKPGGWILLIEKDVLRPNYKPARPTPFSSGTAHQFHLTKETLALYLQAAGFQIIQCRLDSDFATSQNQIVYAVARKAEQTPVISTNLFTPARHHFDAYMQRCRKLELFRFGYAFTGQLRRRKQKILRKLKSV